MAVIAGGGLFILLLLGALPIGGEVGATLVGCGAGIAATLLFESAFWVRVFTRDARTAGIWLAGINLGHLALVFAIRPLLSGLWLIAGTYLLLLACAVVGSVRGPIPRRADAYVWLTKHWQQWVPYLLGNGSGLLLAQTLPLLLTSVAGLEAASSYRGAEILFGGSNLAMAVLSLTMLASAREIHRGVMLRCLAFGVSITAINAIVLWVLPTSAMAFVVGPVAPTIAGLLGVLTIQRLALTTSSLVGVTLVVLVHPRVSESIQIGGAALCAGVVVIGGLYNGLAGALAGLAGVQAAQAVVFLGIYLRRTRMIA